MKQLANTIKWDFILIYRYGIVAIALIVASFYSISFLLTDTQGLNKLVAALIFTDPVMYGFLFTAAMILFEKDAASHQVLAVTPLLLRNYIHAKAFTFTLLALFCSTVILLSARLPEVHLILFLSAVVLSSCLFIFISIIGVSFVNNFNQFILMMPIVLAPVCLPFLDFFGLTESWIFYFIPTQASLILFNAAVSTVKVWEIIYAAGFLILSNAAAYMWAMHAYKKRILKTARNE